jgi:hypothetical protein
MYRYCFKLLVSAGLFISNALQILVEQINGKYLAKRFPMYPDNMIFI